MSIKLKMNQTAKDIIAIEVEKVSAKAPICPFLLGEPGIGKSSIVKAMCDERGWHFHELLCNQLSDRADLTGCRTVKELNAKKEEVWSQIFFPHRAVQDALSDAKENPDDIIVLFLDEVNRTSSDITSAVLSFITARTIGTYTFPDNVRFIVAGNDKGNIVSIDLASMSRFVKYEFVPDATAWMEYERANGGLSPYIEMVINANPDLIFCKETGIVTSTIQDDDGDSYENEYASFDEEAEGFNQITTPRTLSGLNAFLMSCNLSQLTTYSSQLMKDDTGEDVSLLQAIIYGHTGHTQFSLNVIAEIMKDITNGKMKKAAKAVTAPAKPGVYASLKRCKDRDVRAQMISQMSNDEMSALLVYLLWEKSVDNTDLIRTIAQAYPDPYLSMIYHTQLVTLYNNDELDADNFQAFINSGTNVANMSQTVLGM